MQAVLAPSHAVRPVGPYRNAILRFRIDFPGDYPHRPPVVTFQSDVFHPLVTPLTTYTYSTRHPEADTMSAADEHRLPPGGLSLRHGFPEWFAASPEQPPSSKTPQASEDIPGSRGPQIVLDEQHDRRNLRPSASPHIVEVLQYLRVIFDTEEVLDSVPLSVAANTGAWHAWRSYRARTLPAVTLSSVPSADNSRESSRESSVSPQQQPGGARRPGEWNWQGVWEDRVRKSLQASISEAVLFGGDSSDPVRLSDVLPLRITEIDNIPDRVP